MAESHRAILYRMVLPEHTCPFGVRAKEMLETAGYDLDDRVLRTREEVEALKGEFGSRTTPIVIIDDEVIGGSEELEEYLAQQRAGA
jgi:glutaredoxin 3